MLIPRAKLHGFLRMLLMEIQGICNIWYYLNNLNVQKSLSYPQYSVVVKPECGLIQKWK